MKNNWNQLFQGCHSCLTFLFLLLSSLPKASLTYLMIALRGLDSFFFNETRKKPNAAALSFWKVFQRLALYL
jgi:hypothetical protein